MYPIRVRLEYNESSGRLAACGALKEFHLEAGGKIIDTKDVTVAQRQSGGITVTLVSYDADIKVDGEAAVRLSVKALFDSTDPPQIVYAPYPTKGFRATLQFKEGMTYDAAWFRSGTDTAKDFPGREQLETLPNGIAASTDGWLLPGNGVALFWFKPDREQGSPTASSGPAGADAQTRTEIAASTGSG